MALFLTVLTGLIYPGLITGLCQLLFPYQANGSLIRKDGQVIGSELIGQRFTKPEYFHGRPSAAGAEGYDATASGGSNLGPASKELYDRVKADIAEYRKENPTLKGPVPGDAVTTSASGLDPDITIANANAQAARVAKSRGVELSAIQDLVRSSIQNRELGFLGERRINVLKLNLALDRKFPRKQ